MKDKAAIGILIKSLDMGGAEKQSLLQAKLMGVNFDVHYIVQKNKPQLKQHMDFVEKERIKFIQLSGNMFIRTLQLNAYIKKNRIQVLFAYLTSDNFLASSVSIFQKLKFVGGVRSSSLPVMKFYITLVLQKFFLDYTIFNNHFGRDLFVKKGFSSAKSIVIQNCINNIQNVIIRSDRDTIKILSVGRFTAQKDYLTALRTIQLLSDRVQGKKTEYIIVGDGELYQQIQKWVDDLQLTNVTIVRNPDRIDTFYIDADIYFLSSSSEGMPNSIMEALNYSLPVVSTDVGDASYLVKDSINGFLVPVKNCNMLVQKLLELVYDSDKRNAFGREGHNLLIKEYSEDKFREEYINFTNGII
jgi:glycosyltransferase involved in cell wall biosynthesis